MTLNRCFFDFHVWSDKTLCSTFRIMRTGTWTWPSHWRK